MRFQNGLGNKFMIIQNAIKIVENHPQEIFLVSAHVHDYNEYTFKDGTTIAVDGGNHYIKRGGSALGENGLGGYAEKWVEWSLDERTPFKYLKNRLLWGTRGLDGKQPLTYVLLNDCKSEHLQNILKTQTKLSELYTLVIRDILDDRGIA